jgi:SAM-dependent methyltransferase
MTETRTKRTKHHWDQAWRQRDPETIDPSSFPHGGNETNRFFAQQLADLRDAEVLEIGCGQGHLAVYMAQHGARVTAVDVSTDAVRVTRTNAEHNDVSDRLTARQLNALHLDRLPQTYDVVVGRFILHHIEPFDEFTDALDAVLAPSGQGLFLENSSRNRLLMLCRDHLAGRLGIPKYGDDEEYPLSPDEIDVLRASFDVQVHYPELVFLQMMNPYLIGYENKLSRLVELTKSVDDTLHALFPSLRKYSYRQIVEVR